MTSTRQTHQTPTPTPSPTAMTQETVPTTMRAVVQDGYGSADVLRLDEIDVPTPAEGEVLVRVAAAGLSRGTWHMTTGRPYLMRVIGFGFRRPKNRVAGFDVSGTVVGLGPGVTGFAVGDEVFGMARGSFAEYAVARVDKLAPWPRSLTAEQAAVAPVSAGTALQATYDVAGVESGQTVLVIGASGGVGGYVVQLAKAAGAEVTAVCSPGKADYVRGLGADHVVDHTREDFADGEHRYDVVVDLAGNPSVRRLRRALAPRGTAVIVGGEAGGSLTGGMSRQLRALATSTLVKQRLTMLVSRERAGDLVRLGALVDAGTVRPRVDTTYPLADVPTALRRLEAGTVCGQLAIGVYAGPPPA